MFKQRKRKFLIIIIFTALSFSMVKVKAEEFTTDNYKIILNDKNGAGSLLLQNGEKYSVLFYFSLYEIWKKAQWNQNVNIDSIDKQKTENGTKIVIKGVWIDIIHFTETLTIEPEKFFLEYDLEFLADYENKPGSMIALVIQNWVQTWEKIGDEAIYTLVLLNGMKITGTLSDKIPSYRQITSFEVDDVWGKKIEYISLVSKYTDIEGCRYNSGGTKNINQWCLRFCPFPFKEKFFKKGLKGKVSFEVKITDNKISKAEN